MDFIKHFEKNWKNYLIIILIIIIFFSGILTMLFGSSSLNSSKSLSMQESYRGGYTNNNDFAPDAEDRMIVKNANINLESNNYDNSKILVDNLVTTYSVIILSENERKYQSNYRNINYKFKVPSDKLDLFVSEMENVGEINNINVYMLDVTGNYADYTSRLDRYKKQILNYEKMLNKSNLEVKEEIEIQERIDQLEDNIFNLEYRVAKMDNDVSYSDVDLSLTEKQSALAEIDFLGFRDGFKLFINSMQGAIVTILAILGFLVPFLIGFGIYKISRKFLK